jgi:glycosyltransferase involved in cell wall biosynthesis
MKNLAPVIIFTYKRLDTLQQTLESLIKCELSDESDVIIFSDAAKSEKDLNQVMAVRSYLKNLVGFKSIKINFAEKNKGLANSIIEGVTSIINTFGRVIVLEDDLQVSKNFLIFMNASLEFYGNKEKVFSISGFSLKTKIPVEYPFDVYFTPRGLSWGWATWKNRWNEVDWEVKDFADFKGNNGAKKEFALGGTDLFPMLQKQMELHIDSWAIRWFYNQFKCEKLTVYPIKSKVRNLGFDEEATHTNVYNRYKISFDDFADNKFSFASEIQTDPIILKSFQSYYSIRTRLLYGRIISPLFRLKQKLIKYFKKVC